MKSTDNKKALTTGNQRAFSCQHIGSINMTSLALCFNDVKFNPINRDSQIWLKSSEIAEALGYKQENAISKIYNRNGDEFNENMTQVISNPQLPNLGMRVFSLRGCHLLAMFSRTAVAKEFRKWVLDILDKEVGATKPLPVDISLLASNNQHREIKKLVHQISWQFWHKESASDQVFNRLRVDFNLRRMEDLLACQFEEAVDLLNILHGVAEMYSTWRSDADRQAIDLIIRDARPWTPTIAGKLRKQLDLTINSHPDWHKLAALLK